MFNSRQKSRDCGLFHFFTGKGPSINSPLIARLTVYGEFTLTPIGKKVVIIVTRCSDASPPGATFIYCHFDLLERRKNDCYCDFCLMLGKDGFLRKYKNVCSYLATTTSSLKYRFEMT